MKKFLSLIIFSLPITSILVCKIIFKQILAHIPINFPPNITKYFGNINEGKNIIDIKIIPEKKNVLNKIFFNTTLNFILVQIIFVFYL